MATDILKCLQVYTMPRRVPYPQAPDDFSKLPLAVIQDALRARGAEPERLPLIDFIAQSWPTVEGKRKFLPNWHIEAKAEMLTAVADGQIAKLVINEPPGFAKSLVTSVMFPAWQWGPNLKPHTRFLCLSYGGDDASPAGRDAERCRDLIQSPFYQSQWGTVVQLSDTQNAKSYFANKQKGYRVSTGMDGTPSGQRADIVVIDDPTKLDAETLAEILHASEVYERTLVHRALDEGSAFVLIMQRLHPEDLSGYFLKQDGWVHLNFPHFYEADRKCRVFLGPTLLYEDPRTIEGQPLHPLMTTAIEAAHTQQKMRPDIYDGQQQQRPIAKHGQVVTRIDRYDALPNWIDEIIIVVDCAFKAEEDNSFVVFQKWARREANAYLLDQVREHLELPATCEALVAFCAVEPQATAKYVEAKANGMGVVQMLRNRVAGLMTTDDDTEVLKVFCAGSKESKLQAVSPYFLAGNVKIPSKAYLEANGRFDWTPTYVQELTTFPKSRFNDQVDASAMAVWRLLHTFEAHVSQASLMKDDQGNVGLVAGIFGAAYADPDIAGERVRVGGLESGGGGALMGFWDSAYGKG